MFAIFDMKNPPSLQRTESFQFQLRTSDIAYVISSQDAGLSIQNTQVSEITQAEVVASNPTLGADSPYIIQFSPTTPLVKNAIIVLTLPESLNRSDSVPFSCRGVEGSLPPNITCIYDQSSHNITVSTHIERDQNSLQETSFEVTGFRNPDVPRFSQSFQIRTYDQDMYLSEEIVDGLSFTQNCDYPCRTCGLSRKTCLSCQIDKIYKFLFNNTCLATCPPGMYADQNFECQPCSSQCKTCKDTATFCTQCENDKDFLYEKSGKCVKECPEGQFTNTESGTCSECNPRCVTCTSLSVCTACTTDFFLSAGTCYDECPNSMIPSND